MKKPKVSIIIPVYNTADYLEEAVGSILNQTLTELEIIAVNDGSTDNSLEILERIRQKDSRLHIHSQKNRGLSEARNTGMAYATGEFIYLFDSDDMLQKETLAACYQKAITESADIVFFDAGVIGTTGQNAFRNLPYERKHLLESNIVYRGNEILTFLINKRKFSSSPCLIFTRLGYLTSINLNFYSGIIHEDQLFTFLLFLQADKVCFIPENYFKRRMRPHSIMTSPVSIKNIHGHITVCRELAKYAQKPHFAIYRRLINKQIKNLVNITASTAISLNFRTRIDVLWDLVRFFGRMLQPQSVLLLVFPGLKIKKAPNR
ncbi:putative glycosyltransferase EpsJ [termite gut metagenome]|uniref:Putative glycosyltransferase EpsJ n=1 Tax=termite gut metagenome TaxID=433724 RepID=A0A5J4RZZ6_9ZZZZ